MRTPQAHLSSKNFTKYFDMWRIINTNTQRYTYLSLIGQKAASKDSFQSETVVCFTV